MQKKLVIVESPAKAKTINKILGSDYVVRASMGHIRDLPEKKLGVDIDQAFKPHYTTIKGKQKVIKELQQQAEKCDAVYLAPDPDREGEAIAWHLASCLEKQVDPDHFFRVTYNEITASAIRQAFTEPGRIDLHRVESQQARRILDRIVGYMVSPLLWHRIRGSSSAGRVQSVALRLVCEREQEITAFVKEKYWVLGARLRKLIDPRDPFDTKLVRINGEKADVRNQELAERIVEELGSRTFRVAEIKEREVRRRARPPFITSTLQQAGSSFCSFSPARTMRLAQKLYEGIDFGEGPVGLITYMRTDSVSIAQVARDQARTFISEQFGENYVPEKPNIYKSRNSAQEAHEAIRPTDVTRTPEAMAAHLDPAELKLYRLIWQRFVASQMAPARIAQRTVNIDALAPKDGDAVYQFRASASDILFPGFMKVTGEDKRKKKNTGNGNGKEDDENAEVDALPPLKEGEDLECLECLKEEKETQPPPRYSEASLVRALEENGVGRPSTYAAIISTITDRNYVEREKRNLKPTDLGMKVNEFLVSNLGELFDVKFTAHMEDSLDEVEKGAVEWTHMLSDFYGRFEGWLEKAKGPSADPAEVQRVLDFLKAVSEWAPAVKRGKRTYSDEKFCQSIERQLEKGKRKISQRQFDALLKLVIKYREQLQDIDGLLKDLGREDILKLKDQPVEKPREDTLEKLNLLGGVNFDEPRTVGKRTYDDSAFSQSLREQVEGGKRLSVRQIKYLDRLLNKYADQLGGVDELAKQFDFAPEVQVEDGESEELIKLLSGISEWKPPVKRGKRTWDDHEFYESLRKQFERKKALSPKQVASLKKMVQRYAAQIPSYDAIYERFGLKPRKESRPAEEAAAQTD